MLTLILTAKVPVYQLKTSAIKSYRIFPHVSHELYNFLYVKWHECRVYKGADYAKL